MQIDPNPYHHAIRSSYEALRRGDNREARRWAVQAARLASHQEEPWLILAAISGPRAHQAYLDRALKCHVDEPKKPPVRPQRRGLIAKAMLPWLILTLLFSAILLGGAVQVEAGNFPALSASLTNSLAALTSSVQAEYIAALLPAVPTTIPTENQPLAALPTTAPTLTATALPATQTSSPVPTVLPATQTPTPVPTAKPTRRPTAVPTMTGPKHILVSISDHRLYAYQGDSLIYEFVVSTGANDGTLTGSFSILDKIPRAYSYVGGFWMPDWMGIYWFGTELENGIHSLPVLEDGSEIWGDRLGSAMTYGCVVLAPEDSQRLFDWAEIGTPVEIRH